MVTDPSELVNLRSCLDALLYRVPTPLARVLDKVLADGEVTVGEGECLLNADGSALPAIVATEFNLASVSDAV